MDERNVSSVGLTARMALAQAGFQFTHSLGQNFILDDTVVGHIVEAAQVMPGENVLEIGPGAGVMTAQMAALGAKVLAVELDQSLGEVLDKVVGGCAQIRFGDAMKLDLDAEAENAFGPEPYRVVANLPYYITSDILAKLLSLARPPKSITAMIQKEAAERILARPGEKAYCALAATVQYYGNAQVVLRLSREAFTPKPHVDSCLLRIDLHDDRPISPRDEKVFLRLISASFAMRRKTLLNNLCASFSVPRERAEKWLICAELDARVRGEALSLVRLARLSDCISADLTG